MEEIDFVKYDKLLVSIEKQLIMQTSFLESIYNIQNFQTQSIIDNIEDQTRKLQFLSSKSDSEEVDGIPKPSNEDSKSVASGIGTFIQSALAGLSIGKIASLLATGAIAAAIALPIGEFITEAAVEAFSDMGAGTGAANAFGDALGGAVQWGLIGSVFGRKAALLFGLAGASSGLLNDTVSDIFDSNRDGIMSAFGAEFTPEGVAVIGSVLGGGAAAMLRYGPIQAKLLMGVSLLMAAYGDDAAKWLEDQTGVPAEFTSSAIDIATATAYGASLGSMFGPTGAIVGAIAGFAVGTSLMFYEWLEAEGAANRAANLKRLQDELNAAKDEFSRGNVEYAKEEAARIATKITKDIASGIATPEQLAQFDEAIALLSKVDKSRADAILELKKRAETTGIQPEESNPKANTNISQEKIDVDKELRAYVDKNKPDLDDPAVKAELVAMAQNTAVDANGIPTLSSSEIDDVVNGIISGAKPLEPLAPTIVPGVPQGAQVKVDSLSKAATDSTNGNTLNAPVTTVGGNTVSDNSIKTTTINMISNPSSALSSYAQFQIFTSN